MVRLYAVQVYVETKHSSYSKYWQIIAYFTLVQPENQCIHFMEDLNAWIACLSEAGLLLYPGPTFCLLDVFPEYIGYLINRTLGCPLDGGCLEYIKQQTWIQISLRARR